MRRCFILFFLLLSSSSFKLPAAGNLSWEKVRAWFENFEEYLSRTDVITPGQLQKLPVGLRTDIGNYCYDLLFTDAVFGPDHTELSVYLRISGPDWQGEERVLYFGADKVLISQRGGFIGEVKLALLGDVSMKGKGDQFHLRFLGRKEEGSHEASDDGLPPTYAIVNCEGFQELQISAVLEIGNGAAVLVEKGKLTEKPLRASFFCTATGLDDILVKVDVPEFAIKHLPDWRFSAEEVMLDFSQRRNVPGFKGYSIGGQSASGNPAFSEIWQGLYAEKILLGFPDYIKKADGARPSVRAEDFWWDERGCTGFFAASDLLRLDEGSLGGWGFSIEEFSFDLKQDRLAGGGMEGSINLPVSKLDAYDYELGFKEDGTWDMTLGLGEKAHFEFLKAREVELYASSFLRMAKEEDSGLLLCAELSGRMMLNPMAKENDRFGFANLEFQGMRVQNKAPYFEVNRVSWDDGLQIGNFPVSIQDIEIRGKAEDLSLSFTTQVHLGDASDAHFGGELGLELRSRIEESEGKQKWNFEGVDVGRVQLDFSNNYLSFSGGVDFVRDHAVYGNGFQGWVDFMIKPLEMGLRADLMIGSKPSFRYWYADLLLRLGPTGIPVFPGFKISALGGGAYKHMDLLSAEEASSGSTGFGQDVDFGETSSGLTYIPDSTKSLGLKAMVGLAMQEDKLFNAELTFEMLFNSHGGVSRIGLQGVGKLMTRQSQSLEKFNQQILNMASKIQPTLEEKRMAAASEASITAEVGLEMDFDNRAFTGNFDAYMDLGVIKGAGSKGHLGTMGMYFGTESWYVKVGEPAHPLGVQLKVGPLKAGLDSYFMTGSHLPAFPALPANVAGLLNEPYERPDLETLHKGAGLAFGSSLNLTTGTIPMLIFYGAFDAQVGFDLMMKQYPNSLCQETGTEPGINGWYAKGQAYAYMMADIGLYLKLFGKNRNFSVLKGEVGAMLRAGLPNPASFAGSLGLNVSILNGLVRGKFNLDFDLGEPCTILAQEFADGADVIASTLPEKEAESVDIFSIPQASFNLPVEIPIREEYQNQERELEITLDQYELWHGGTRLEGKFEYEEENRVVKFIPHDALPANARLDFKLAVGAREKRGSSWSDLEDSQGNDYQEERMYSFRTGEGPDSIPWENVKYCYPVKDQQYFFPKEYRKGFIYLNQGMAYLLADPSYRKRVLFVSAADSLEVAFTYNQQEKRLSWFMPEDLALSTQYELQVVLEEKPDGSRPVANPPSSSSVQTSRLDNATLFSSSSGSLQQETVTLTASQTKADKSKVILRYAFHTSRYPDFGAKMADLRLLETYRTPVIYQDADGHAYVTDPDVHYLQADMQAGEPFCRDEKEGSRYTAGKALVQVTADLGNEPYYQEDIYPLVYKEYPYGGMVRFEREPGQDLVPDWAVYPSAFQGQSQGRMPFPWIYGLPIQYKEDFHAVLTSVAEKALWTNPYYYSWLGKHFKPIRDGAYPVFLRYVLPDGTVTSQRRLVFENY